MLTSVPVGSVGCLSVGEDTGEGCKLDSLGVSSGPMEKDW